MNTRAALPFFAAALLLGAGGCLSSRESLEQEIRAGREASADAWSNRLERADAEVPRLEGELVLADALKVALLHNKALQSALLEKDVAAGRITESYGQALPTLSANAGYTRVGPADSFIPTAPGDPYTVMAGSLQLKQPLYKGGAIGSALRASRLYAFWADEGIRGAIQDVLHAVASAFYEVLLAERLEAAARAALNSSTAQFKTAQDLARAGAASRYDVLRAEVAVANGESDLIQQQNRQRLARARLFNVMGVTAAPELNLAGELVYEPAAPTAGEALRLAHLNRPDLRQADLLVRLQAESLNNARSRYQPTVNGVASHNWTHREDGTPVDGRWLQDWTAGLQVELPLFDGLAREGRVAQEKALLARRRTEAAGAEEQVLLEISQSLASLEDAEKVVLSQRLNLARAREALALAEAGFKEGVNTSTDLTDARAALRLAEGLHAQALHAHTAARLALRKAAGLLKPGDPDPASLVEFQNGARP